MKMKSILTAPLKTTLVVICVMLVLTTTQHHTASAESLEHLHNKILHDIVHSYTLYTPTPTPICPDSSDTTTFTDEWPGVNTASIWDSATVEDFEQALFQTKMSHTDTDGNRSWEIRIGTSGNIYSHFVPDMYGETMPPQKHKDAPWIDEVHQSVSVNTALNDNSEGGIKYFIHEAGAYQRDSSRFGHNYTEIPVRPNYTDIPFFSPSLGKHCERNYCMFASWGTSAHVPTPYVSQVIFINKYTNCGNGIIEHTQMIHNFAEALNPGSANPNVDQTYFNVPWSGVRPSNLPNALEPRARSISSTSLSYFPPNNVDILSLKGWGGDVDKNQYAPCTFNSYLENLNKLGGYTTFAGDELLVSRPEILRWCRKHNYADASDCHSSSNVETTSICMVSSCRCEGDTAPAEGYTEIDLRVPPDTKPTCKVRGNNVYKLSGIQYVELKCSFRDTGFGRTGVYLEGNFGFYRGDTGVGIDVLYVRHWAYLPGTLVDDGLVHFATNYVDDGSGGVNRTAAKNYVQNLFDNTGSSDELKIEFQYSSSPPDIIPQDYDAGSVSAFTFVYGQGQDYASKNTLPGWSRRRIGRSGRDFTVFTINWLGGSIKPGEMYSNRMYVFSSDLASVEATAEALSDEVTIDKFDDVDYTPRKVDLYEQGTSFTAVSASEAGGNTATCGSDIPQLATDCQGWSTPKAGYVAYFFITCGSSTRVSWDPYYFTPGAGTDFSFPGHATSTSFVIRSYVCDGQDQSIRPSWTLLGFFPTTCSSLAALSYDDNICQPTPDPTNSPSASPSTKSPTAAQTTPPSKTPSDSPVATQSDTLSPSKSPTNAPITKSPTAAPTTPPSNSPSNSPVATQSDTLSPSKSPTSSPTPSPSELPSIEPSSKADRIENEANPSAQASVEGSLSINNGVGARRELVSYSEAEIEAFEDAIESVVCAGLPSNQMCVDVRVLNITDGFLHFDLVLQILCTAVCDSGEITAVADSATNAVGASLTAALTDDGSGTSVFAAALEASYQDNGLTNVAPPVINPDVTVVAGEVVVMSTSPSSQPSSLPSEPPSISTNPTSSQVPSKGPTKSPITTSDTNVYNKSPTATKTTITGTTSATSAASCTAADEAAARSKCCVTQEQWKTTAGIMCTAANYTVGSGCEAEATNMKCSVTSRRRLVEGRGLLTTYTVKSTAELRVAITAYCETCTEAQVATLTATVTAQVEKGVAAIDLTCPSGAALSACSTTTTKVVVKNPLTLDIKRWYPLWKNNNNKNTCANDGNYEMYMLNNGFFKASLDACCKAYFNWDYQACLVEAGGAAAETGKFYVDYIKKHCVQDCLEDGKTNMAAGACTNPGGSADTWKTLYADAKMCCKNKLWYVPAETCEAQSLGGSLTSVTYVGSSNWYVASDGKDCVQDCNENSGPQCKPTRGNWEDKYESSAACCKEHFNWLMEDKDVCKTARTYTNDRRE